jgi:hypothetical protein
MTDAPSGWKVSQALSAWQSARSRLLADDPDADVDAVLGPETDDVREILSRLLSAEQWSSAQAEGAKTLIADMDTRRHRFLRQKETARGVMFAVMEALETAKEVFPHGTISVSAGKPAVVITNEAALDDRFVVIKRTPNKTEIATALKDGEVVEGAVLSNSLPTLTIRGK